MIARVAASAAHLAVNGTRRYAARAARSGTRTAPHACAFAQFPAIFTIRSPLLAGNQEVARKAARPSGRRAQKKKSTRTMCCMWHRRAPAPANAQQAARGAIDEQCQCPAIGDRVRDQQHLITSDRARRLRLRVRFALTSARNAPKTGAARRDIQDGRASSPAEASARREFGLDPGLRVPHQEEAYPGGIGQKQGDSAPGHANGLGGLGGRCAGWQGRIQVVAPGPIPRPASISRCLDRVGIGRSSCPRFRSCVACRRAKRPRARPARRSAGSNT